MHNIPRIKLDENGKPFVQGKFYFDISNPYLQQTIYRTEPLCDVNFKLNFGMDIQCDDFIELIADKVKMDLIEELKKRIK